tara:strand:- start:24847 stop:27756 length:2910 start_codon:yes stop_codon:yes gene_type:complete
MAKEQLQLIVEAQGISATKKQLNKLEQATGGTTSSFTKFAVGIAGATAAFVAIKEGIGFAIEKGKEFEKGLANLKSISGASAIDLENLSGKARDLGASTAFTASEVTNLMTEYAKLGFKPEEIDQATEATLKLAGAFGVELDEAASVAGGTVRAFGMTAGETSRVTDVMAQSFSTSALDMAKFSESMKYVGPIAKAAGLDVEDTTGILGVLADNMISGSQAGTALRKILLEAGKEGSKLAERMGGPVESMDDLITGIKKLDEDGFNVMNEGADLVGKNAVTAFGILVDGIDDIESLTETLDGAGEAFDGAGASAGMYEIQMDTTAGKMDILKSATESLGITIFDSLGDSVKGSLDFMTSFVNGIENAIKFMQDLDFGATAKNMVTNLGALGEAIYGSFKVYFDLLPDLFWDAIKKVGPLAVEIFTAVSEAVKNWASYLWEPIPISAEIMWTSVKMGFATLGGNIENIMIKAINGVKSLFNDMADSWIGEKMGLKPVKMTDLVNVNDIQKGYKSHIKKLRGDLAKTSLYKDLMGFGEDNIKSTDQASKAIAKIWGDYRDKVVVMDDEEKARRSDENENRISEEQALYDEKIANEIARAEEEIEREKAKQEAILAEKEAAKQAYIEQHGFMNAEVINMLNEEELETFSTLAGVTGKRDLEIKAQIALEKQKSIALATEAGASQEELDGIAQALHDKEIELINNLETATKESNKAKKDDSIEQKAIIELENKLAIQRMTGNLEDAQATELELTIAQNEKLMTEMGANEEEIYAMKEKYKNDAVALAEDEKDKRLQANIGVAEGIIGNLDAIGNAMLDSGELSLNEQKNVLNALKLVAVADAAAAVVKVWASSMALGPIAGPIAAGVATVAIGAATYAQIKKIDDSIAQLGAEYGMDRIIDEPTTIMVGEKGKREHVQVTPLESPNLRGPRHGSNITVNISAPLVDEHIADVIIPKIDEAFRRGERFKHLTID